MLAVDEEFDVGAPDHQPQLVPGGGKGGNRELHQGLRPHLVQAGQVQRHLLDTE